MSGKWLSAAKRTRLYQGAFGDGVVSNQTTRFVLAELCSMANNAGVVYAPHTKIAERTGISSRMVRKAIKRLKDDGWLVEVRRGVGNKHDTAARPSVWLIARLPDGAGNMLPDRGYMMREWVTFKNAPRSIYQTVKKYELNTWHEAQSQRIHQYDEPVENLDKGPFYKRPVNGLQAARAGRLLNKLNKTEKEKVTDGGKPPHWRQGRSTASLSVVAGTGTSSSDGIEDELVVAEPDPPANPDPQVDPDPKPFRKLTSAERNALPRLQRAKYDRDFAAHREANRRQA